MLCNFYIDSASLGLPTSQYVFMIIPPADCRSLLFGQGKREKTKKGPVEAKKVEKDEKKKPPPFSGCGSGRGKHVKRSGTCYGASSRTCRNNAKLCEFGLDEENAVVSIGVKPVEIWLDARGQKRPRKDETEDYCFGFSWPDTCPTCKPGVMAGAIALAPLKAAHRTTFDLASMAVRCARLDAARRAS
ncbi:MAG: hypothetical protein AB7D39_17340 [Pseudodesulfovibrio sp.]|uniref:hypothetical protein n=1 Tax=Pseudodesulfovibrio sp. TaxID=2035812 RepID=UPI003D0D94B6